MPNRSLRQFGRQTWLTENGLPGNTVHAIMQTSDGYIWVATEEGLARFDGVSFTIFDTRNTPQFRSNDIRALAEDRRGALWIGTASGLVRLAGTEFRSFTRDDRLPSEVIQRIYKDSHDNLWVATAGGLARYKDGAFTSRQGIPGNTVEAFFEDRDGTLWIGTPAGLSQFKDEKFVERAMGDSFANGSVFSISQDADGRMWFGTLDGLVSFDHGRQRVYSTRDGLPNNRVTGLLTDQEGTLWVGTAAGLARMAGDRFVSFEASDPISSDGILSIFEDREGSVWVGAESAGLGLIKDTKFTTYTIKDGLGNDLVKSVYEDHFGNLWFGTNGGGLTVLKNGVFSSYTTKDGLSSNVVLALFGDDQGALWVGTPDGLDRFKDGKFTVYTSADGLADDFVRSVYMDHDRNLWVGTRGGLTLIKDGSFAVYTSADGLPDNLIGPIYEDEQHNVWIGTLGGLSRFRDGKFISYTTKDGLSSDVVISLYQNDEGGLWIGTNGGGLDRYADGKFTQYMTTLGLPDDVVYQILEDDHDNLWLSGGRGIFRLSKTELNDVAAGKASAINPVAYGTADGMLTRECSGGGQPAGWKGSDGKLWFPTIKGVAMIDPASFRTNEQRPGVVVEKVNVDDQEVRLDQKIELAPGTARLDFYYAGLSFIAPEKVRFKYKLEGFDGDWVDGGTRRVVSYTNLPAGNYRFRVIACNNDGVWNETGASFAFYLKPHFYRTYWFYALCVMAVALLIWQLYRYRVKQVEARFSAVLGERTRIAREIHDNLAQDMLGVSVQLELVARMTGISVEATKTHLDRARVLVRNSVAEARRYVWDLRSLALEKDDLPKALNEMARRLTADTSVQAQVQVTGTFRPLAPAIEDNLLRIGQEAINNAVKHAQAQRVLINLRFDAQSVQLGIRDDGRGFDPLAQNVDGHFGLVGMRERAEQIGGKLSIRSDQGSGTEVLVDVPIDG
jgi:ligand-binding sensor domain-containing protein/signal transduction histidine kinase